MKFKKFRSVDSEIKRVALLNGQITLIDSNWKELPETMWSSAYSHGCISEDMLKENILKDMDPAVISSMASAAGKRQEIEETLIEWVEDGDKDKFDTKDRPKISEMRKVLGNEIQRAALLEIWDKIKAEGKVV